MLNPFTRIFGKKQDNAPERDVDELAAPLAAPAIHLVTGDAPTRSHFGGSPRLPSDVSWPERNGAKLGFLARLSLSEIRAAHPVPWLPSEGALLFFYDMEHQPWGYDPKDRGSSAVLLVPDLSNSLEQCDADADADDNASPFPYLNIALRRIQVLPSEQHEAVRALHLTDPEFDAFCDLGDAPFDGRPKHQVSGFPAPVQGDDMELECQLVSNGIYCGNPSGYKDPRVPELTPGAANWRLLLQLDTDDTLDVMWGDCGTIYYWIREEEAKSGNFANTWLIQQCS